MSVFLIGCQYSCGIKIKIENGNGECVKETTTRPNKKTTAEGHQQVFNVARNSRTRRRPSAGP
jgi:hypothetical protein